MAELPSPPRSPLRPSSQSPLWSPLLGRQPSRLAPPLSLPSSLPLQPPLPVNRSNGAHVRVPPRPNYSNPNPQGLIPPPTSEYGRRSLAPLPTGFRPNGLGTSFVGARPFGFGLDHCARPPPPQVNMNAYVENKREIEMVQALVHKRKTEMVQVHTSAFALLRRGTGVFHPVPQVHAKPSKNNNKGIGQKEGGTSRPRNVPNGNDGLVKQDGNDGLVKQEEWHQLSPSSELGLPKEWPY